MREKAKREREREKRKRTRIHLKHQQAEAEMDKPYADTNPRNAEEKEVSLQGVPRGVLSNPPTSTSKSKKQEATGNRKYTEDVMRVLVAIWRVLKILLWPLWFLFRFIDEHHGIVTAAATAAICVLTYYYVGYSKKQWEVAQETLHISQGAYVSIGSKDGLLAQFKRSSNRKFSDGLVMYFQNSGHLPAIFNWGIQPSSLFPFNPPHPFAPMSRMRNKKTGAITESFTGAAVIGGESVQQFTVADLPPSFIDSMSLSNRVYTVNGVYEYCDELGKYSCKMFSLYYQRIPYDSFRLLLEQDCPDLRYLGKPTPKTDEEDLPLCTNQQTPRFPNR